MKSPLLLFVCFFRLNDPSTFVRYNTLMVLTHLILNDMIKVKGQVFLSFIKIFKLNC